MADQAKASTTIPGPRDYRLDGADSARAVERGLAEAAWFQPEIDPDTLRALQTRTNARATVDQLLWLALVVISGVVAVRTVWSWWSIPAFWAYGALYAGAADSRWHECSHGTAFRWGWANDAVYHLASFMLLRGPTVWRWSHYRHHTDSIIVGRDAEIAFPRPAHVGRTIAGFTGYWVPQAYFGRLVRHALGRLDGEARVLVPAHEHRRVVWESRVFVAVVGAAVGWSLATWSVVPVLVIGGPSVYGAWLMVFFGITQHAGLGEDVLDHRLNSRTVLMNPVFRFLYLNMNYHVEHHLLPSVPYPNLPALHAEIGAQLAPPKANTWVAYREIFTTLWRQQHDPTYELPIEVPPTGGGPRASIEVGEELWVRGPDGHLDLGPAHTLAPGELRAVEIEGRPLVLGRLDDGTVTLLDGLCTHQRVLLSQGTLVGTTIECPKHNGRFDACSGRAVRPPATVDLGSHRIEERHGRLVARIEEPPPGPEPPGSPRPGSGPESGS